MTRKTNRSFFERPLTLVAAGLLLLMSALVESIRSEHPMPFYGIIIIVILGFLSLGAGLIRNKG